MNKLAILSDIHANLPAFREVLREIKSLNISEVFLGGDLVGYGASPAECVELAMAENMSAVMGNHDWEAIRFPPNWHRSPKWRLEKRSRLGGSGPRRSATERKADAVVEEPANVLKTQWSHHSPCFFE
jgi:predicted phosphodiesterase